MMQFLDEDNALNKSLMTEAGPNRTTVVARKVWPEKAAPDSSRFSFSKKSKADQLVAVIGQAL